MPCPSSSRRITSSTGIVAHSATGGALQQLCLLSPQQNRCTLSQTSHPSMSVFVRALLHLVSPASLRSPRLHLHHHRTKAVAGSVQKLVRSPLPASWQLGQAQHMQLMVWQFQQDLLRPTRLPKPRGMCRCPALVVAKRALSRTLACSLASRWRKQVVVRIFQGACRLGSCHHMQLVVVLQEGLLPRACLPTRMGMHRCPMPSGATIILSKPTARMPATCQQANLVVRILRCAHMLASRQRLRLVALLQDSLIPPIHLRRKGMHRCQVPPVTTRAVVRPTACTLASRQHMHLVVRMLQGTCSLASRWRMKVAALV
mmetsp:Transcript_60284/g.156615  ORF Transcript_60284/g.156615 Transcript_60284/m.156615 type:complete len:315 (+) Transcript_60284:180-1124(+)